MRSCGWAAGLLLFTFGSTSLQAQVAEQAPDTAQTAPPTDPSTTAQRGDASSGEAPSAKSKADEKKWKFATIGYAWFAGAEGKTDVIGPVDPVDLDLSFGDVLKAFKFAFMGAAEARRDRLVILGDLTFIHLEANDGLGIRDPDFLEAELDSRTAEITLLGGYRVVNKDSFKLDLLAGARMNFFKITLQLEGPVRSAEGSEKQKWLDPLIAARAAAPLGGKWSMSFYGDLGGILFGSDVTWQGVASVDYQISRKMTLGAGWRYFKVNYDDGDFLYNVAQSGPLIVFRTEL
jgi:hypothetical protein